MKPILRGMGWPLLFPSLFPSLAVGHNAPAFRYRQKHNADAEHRAAIEGENAMFNLNDKDYRITEHVQADMRRQADDVRLAQDADDTRADGGLLAHRRRLTKALAVLMVLVAIFAGVGQAFAQGPQPLTPDAGGPPEPYADAMRAYREGLYALNHGDPQLAAEWLTAALEGIPAEAIAVVPAYQDMYWVLGEAQEAAGSSEAALISYRHWLTLAGDEAAPWTVIKVQDLEAQLNAALVMQLLVEQVSARIPARTTQQSASFPPGETGYSASDSSW
jgi:hypothetical protein